MKNKIFFHPIGIIHTPFNSLENMPVQPPGGASVRGKVEVFPEYAAGLKDLEGFSHVILLYHFHLSSDYLLQVRPFLDEAPRGLFATRAPNRPNSLGISVVRLLKIEGNELFIEDVDMVQGTPLLDIKPYVPVFDIRSDASSGWLSHKGDLVFTTRSDGRFLKK